MRRRLGAKMRRGLSWTGSGRSWGNLAPPAGNTGVFPFSQRGLLGMAGLPVNGPPVPPMLSGCGPRPLAVRNPQFPWGHLDGFQG